MMKFTILLTVLACAAGIGSYAENVKTAEGYRYHHRDRLGHFSKQPFIDLYKAWALGNIIPQEGGKISFDDARSYAPAAIDCIPFFTKYRENKYKLKRIEDFVILDACLGYLYDDQITAEELPESSQVQEKIRRFIEDPILKDTYTNTEIDNLPDAGKTCIANLFTQAIQLRLQKRDVHCDTDWLQVFLQFAHCHNDLRVVVADRENDTYVKILYDLLKNEGQSCFSVEIRFLNEAVREIYVRSYSQRFLGKIRRLTNPIIKQVEQRKWPENVANILWAVQGMPAKEINMRQIHQLLKGVYEGDEILKNALLRNMADYATKLIRPKSKHSSDPRGEKRYSELVVDNLCAMFRSGDRSKIDFSKSLVRMVQLLAHQDVFSISEAEFLMAILQNSYETASLYLSVMSCNILNFTEGELELEAANGPVKYTVRMSADTEGMVVWPVAKHY